MQSTGSSSGRNTERNLVKCIKRKISELQQHRLQISLKVKFGGLTDHSIFKMNSLSEWLSHAVSPLSAYWLRVWQVCEDYRGFFLRLSPAVMKGGLLRPLLLPQIHVGTLLPQSISF